MERLKSIGHSIFKPRLALQDPPPSELSPPSPQLRTPTPRPDFENSQKNTTALRLKSKSANSFRNSTRRNTVDNQTVREVKSVPVSKPKASRRIGITFPSAKKKSATFNLIERYETNNAEGHFFGAKEATAENNCRFHAAREWHSDANADLGGITTNVEGFLHPITRLYNTVDASIKRSVTAHELEEDMMKAMSRAEKYMLKAIKLEQEADELLPRRRLAMQLKGRCQEVPQATVDTSQHSVSPPLHDIPEESSITSSEEPRNGNLLTTPAKALNDSDNTGTSTLI